LAKLKVTPEHKLFFNNIDPYGQPRSVSVTDLCVAARQQPLRKSRRADFRHIYGVSPDNRGPQLFGMPAVCFESFACWCGN
jgi:hypothetical protein